jgi:hypothetical protein
LQARQAAERTEQKRILADLQKRRREYLAELEKLEADRAAVAQLEQRNVMGIVELKRDHEEVIAEIKREHEQEVEKLRAKQKREVENMIGEIEAVRNQRLKKCASDREKYRSAVQALMREDDMDGETQTDHFEEEIAAVRARKERLIFQIKAAYERVIADEELKLHRARARAEEELRQFRATLEEQKQIERNRAEIEILAERKKALKKAIQHKNHVEKWSVKPISGKIPGNSVRLHISAPISFERATNATGKSDSASLTEVPPFPSLQPPRNGNGDHSWMFDSAPVYARSHITHHSLTPDRAPRPRRSRALTESESESEPESDTEPSVGHQVRQFRKSVHRAKKARRSVKREFRTMRRAFADL